VACETIYVRFFTFFNVFFQNPKNVTFYVFLSCCTRFLEHCICQVNGVKLADILFCLSVYVCACVSVRTQSWRIYALSESERLLVILCF